MSADPLDTGEDIDATIVSRPILTKGVFLIFIVGCKISMGYNEKSYGLIADFSKARLPEDIGLKLLQIMKITSLCLQKTLGNQH